MCWEHGAHDLAEHTDPTWTSSNSTAVIVTDSQPISCVLPTMESCNEDQTSGCNLEGLHRISAIGRDRGAGYGPTVLRQQPPRSPLSGIRYGRGRPDQRPQLQG